MVSDGRVLQFWDEDPAYGDTYAQFIVPTILSGGRNSEEDYGCLATIIVGPVPEKRGLHNYSTQKQRNITRGWNTFAA
jgi:hypothetical protein